MSEGSGDPVEIYRARSLPEAHALLIALEREGIAARIDNEMLQNAIGELAAGWTTAPRVLVGPADESAARALLERFLQQARNRAEAEEQGFHCLACGTAMDQADACPECGWSYSREPGATSDLHQDTPSVGPAATEHKPEVAEASAPGQESTAAPMVLTRRAIWGEVGAVLAVGVVPHLVGTVDYLAAPPSAVRPYWLDTSVHTVLSGCKIFVVLYLIYRSGEPSERFGLHRPGFWDVLLGIGLFLVAMGLWLFCCRPVPWDSEPLSKDLFPRPQYPVDYLLMVLAYGVSGFAEELINRAYLVTRFEQLFRSRASAVLLSATLYATYHGYQGIPGVADTMAFGVVYGVAFLLLRRVWPLAIGHALYNLTNTLTR